MAAARRCKMAGPANSATAAGYFRPQRRRYRLVGLRENATLVGLMIPFCAMAVVNGGIYPIVVAQALKPFPQATGRAAALQNTLQLGLCFLTSLLVSTLIATPLQTTTSVMLVSIVLAGMGYRMQHKAAHLATKSSHA